MGIAFGIAYMALGIVLGIAGGIADGIALGIGSIVTLLRLYYHPLFWWISWPKPLEKWYSLHPVAWDSMCSVPFPAFDKLLVANAEANPKTGEKEIERLITTYPAQRMSALRARTILIARQCAMEKELSRLDTLVASLPEGDKGFLSQIPKLRAMVHQITLTQIRLDTISRPLLRESYARILCRDIGQFSEQLVSFPEPLNSEFRAATASWLGIASFQKEQVQKILKNEPNPQIFRAGDPVNRDQEAFVPRYSVLGELERQILMSTGCPGLVLYGRRRTGKSTVLRNLIAFLPEHVKPVSISMQSAEAFTSLAHLISTIEKNAD